MKGKIRGILRGLMAEKANTLLMIVLFAAQAAVLSMILMFSGGGRIAESLAKTVKLDIAYSNDFMASPHYNPDAKTDPYPTMYELIDSDPEGFCKYLSAIKDGMRALGQSDDISYYNFNIITAVTAPGFKRLPGADLPGSSGIALENLFGIENFSFFEINDIGFDSCSSQELTEDSLFVPAGAQIRLSDGSLRPVQLGDKVEITNPGGTLRHTFTVQGIYRSEFRFDYSYGFDDSFINSSGIVVPNKSIEKYLFDEKDAITLRSTIINHPVYRLSHYSRISSLEEKMEKFALDMKSFAKDGGLNAPQLKLQQTEAIRSLGSIKGVANLYSGVFAVVELMLLVLLAGFLYYLVSKKKREMYIYYSLGEDKKAVALRSSLYFGTAGAVGALIGCIPGYFLSRMLSSAVARNSLKIQSELLRYSYYGRSMIKALDQLSFEGLGAGDILKCVLFTVLITLVITAIIVFISTFILMRGNMRDNIGGGD